MTAIGKYNNTSTGAYFVVGNGSSTSSREDAFVVETNGNVQISGTATANVNNVLDVYLGCPIGTIVMWPGYTNDNGATTVADGWALCNGGGIRIKATETETSDTVFSKYCVMTSSDTPAKYYTSQKIYFEIFYQNSHRDYKKLIELFSKNNNRSIYGSWVIQIEGGDYTISFNDDGSHPTSATSIDINSFIDSFNDENTFRGFKLPDLREKFPLGAKSGTTIGRNGHSASSSGWSITLGKSGGEDTTTLSAIESGLPAHDHTTTVFAVAGSGSGSNKIKGDSDGNVVTFPFTSDENTTQDAQSSHNNIPPFLAINFIIKYK